MNIDKKDFYVGYHKMPSDTMKFIWFTLATLFVLTTITAVLHFVLHQKAHTGVSNPKRVGVEGVLLLDTYPMLLHMRKGIALNDVSTISRYYIVPNGKRGFSLKRLKKYHGQYVYVKGKLIYRDNQTMIVTHTKHIKIMYGKSFLTRKILRGTKEKLIGKFTLRGEIVDSKCYLGQMNPGAGKTHRACATLCIRGGLPPLFVARFDQGNATHSYFVLVSSTNKSVNQTVLNLVGEPIVVTGNIIQKDNLYLFQVRSDQYKRLSPF